MKQLLLMLALLATPCLLAASAVQFEVNICASLQGKQLEHTVATVTPHTPGAPCFVTLRCGAFVFGLFSQGKLLDPHGNQYHHLTSTARNFVLTESENVLYLIELQKCFAWDAVVADKPDQTTNELETLLRKYTLLPHSPLLGA